MIEFQMTVPNSGARYIDKFRVLANQTSRLTDFIETKDGFIFMFEFISFAEQEYFKRKTDQLFPNLFK